MGERLSGQRKPKKAKAGSHEACCRNRKEVLWQEKRWGEESLPSKRRSVLHMDFTTEPLTLSWENLRGLRQSTIMCPIWPRIINNWMYSGHWNRAWSFWLTMLTKDIPGTGDSMDKDQEEGGKEGQELRQECWHKTWDQVLIWSSLFIQTKCLEHWGNYLYILSPKYILLKLMCGLSWPETCFISDFEWVCVIFIE